MTVIEDTLGAMLQGVSQQPFRVRPPGKVSEQINLISNVVTGLQQRPALKHLITWAGITSGMRFSSIEINSYTYLLGYDAGIMRVWNQAGTEFPVVFQDASAAAYINTDLATHVYDNVVYITNRKQVVLQSAAVDTSSIVQNVCYLYCLGGQFSRTYTATIKFGTAGASFTTTYVTPAGDVAGDAAKTDSKFIALTLRNNLAAQVLPVGTTVIAYDNTVCVRTTATLTGVLTITCDDGSANLTLRCHGDTVSSLEDMSQYALNGSFLKVTGNSEGNEDDFYMRFETKLATSVGTGFGTAGVWEEIADIRYPTALNAATMPHTLTQVGASFQVNRGVWLPRRAGDAETNTMPAIVGRTIRDISAQDSRLVFIAGPYCCMSRNNIPTDFFKQSGTADFDTDPIEVRSTKEGSTTLDWIIPFDRDLILLSDPGNGQFIVTGGDKLTPTNASIVLTTSYEMSGLTRPVRTGKTIIFPYKSGQYSGLNEFFAEDSVSSNGVDSLTETASKYIPGVVDHMVCSTNFKTVLLKSNDPASSDIVWVYRYLWEGTNKVQSSLSKWKMPGKVRNFFFSNSEIYFVLEHSGDTSFNVMDLDTPLDTAVGYHVCLDRKATTTVGVDSKRALLLPGLYFVQSTGCQEVGREVLPLLEVTALGTTTYSFDPITVPSGASVIYGYKFQRSVMPTMPLVRERDGSVSSRYDLMVSEFQVYFNQSGPFSSVLESPYRDTQEFRYDWFQFSDDPLDPNGVGMRTGDVGVAWGERSDWSELTLKSDDIRPTTFLEVRWSGHRI